MKNKLDWKIIGIFCLLFLIFALILYFGAFSHVRSILTDSLHGNQNVLENIVLIKIDDYSINKIGRWPWNRDVFAQLIDKTKNAKIVGVDVSFFEPSPNDDELMKVLEQNNNIVLAAEISDNEIYRPIFNSDYGYVNLVTDRDGVTRSIDYGLINEAEPFSFIIYKKLWSNNLSFEEKRYFINFPSSPNGFNSLSAYDVLNGDFDFGDKFVLIGATAPNLHDIYFVPTSEGMGMAGVEIHAIILQNLILDDFLIKQEKLSILILILIFGYFCFFVFSKIKIYYVIPIIIVFLILYVFISIFLFSRYNYVVDLFFVPIGIFIFTGVGIGMNYLQEKLQKIQLSRAFEKYMSKELLKDVLSRKEELKLGGEKKEISIFFSDIRGFTTLSEKMKPEELVSFINQYLTAMTSVIMQNKGVVDKFIGDAIMAIWNAPLDEKNHAYLACNSAIEQVNTLNNLKKKWKKKKLPEINIGCGINTGEVIVGNLGSHERFDYTALGDNVNLASRLEGLTKIYGVSIIISESTYNLIKDKFRCRRLDFVKVKGKDIPITIYELCVDFNENFVNKYEKALQLYLKRDFKNALKEFENANRLRKKDLASKLFIERCKEYIRSPPGREWKGEFVMKEK